MREPRHLQVQDSILANAVTRQLERRNDYAALCLVGGSIRSKLTLPLLS